MKIIFSLLLCTFISACSINAPKYQPSTDNSNLLQDTSDNKLSVGEFTQKSPDVNDLSLRGGSLVSPYNESYTLYLNKALEEELKLAGIWDNKSTTKISGTLIENELDISGFSVGTASIKVKFVVTRDSNIVYSKQLSASHEWESSFIGAIAIPAGQNNYHIVVQKLFNKLFSDKDFMAAIK
ncbi:hypothetical protein MNBD_GAMMA11-2817 [hydrothermal vent metagenome]|uniref:Lipoprotein n=1 Tax=hydrothermal vent metagenome TaxID=652676 RepID=A0A3B0XQ19_9ZZZZ